MRAGTYFLGVAYRTQVKANLCSTSLPPVVIIKSSPTQLLLQAWGWVLEMYGFTLACYNVGLPPASLHPKMMSQPPWDTKLEPFYILHYTYGMDYTLEVSLAWLKPPAFTYLRSVKCCSTHAPGLSPTIM